MFIENNQSFLCSECGMSVLPHPTSSRNHCNNCLTSLHVDIEPGDRKEKCQGIMKPVGLETKEGKTQLVFICTRCGARRKNIVAPDDNQDLLVKLSTQPIEV